MRTHGAIDCCHQDRAGSRRRDAFPIEDVKVSGRFQQQFCQAALENRQACEVGDAINGFLEGALHRREDQTPLQFVREHARRQGERFIERIDAVGAGVGVAHANNLDRSENSLEGAGADPTMCVQHFVVPLLDAQSGTQVSVAAALKVSLKQ